MVFKSGRLGKKIRGQGQKHVFSRTFLTNLTKLFVIFHGLIKMTMGCHSLESEPEVNKEIIRTIYPPDSNYTQCFNIPSGHRFETNTDAPGKKHSSKLWENPDCSGIPGGHWQGDRIQNVSTDPLCNQSCPTHPKLPPVRN
jgi:hypothetical protein